VIQRGQVDPIKDDDFYVTDDAGEPCMTASAPCTRVGDFLIDGDVCDGKPAFTKDARLSSVQGIVSGFSYLYTLEPRDPTDITP
jgi:hypothetical protein